MRGFFSKFFILVAIVCALTIGYLIWERINPSRLSFDVAGLASSSNSNANYPKELLIPALALRLPVIPTSLQKGKWEATTQGISYLVESPVPGDTGNSIIYGHNFPNLLGKLSKIKPGETIEVILGNNEKKSFVVEYTLVVTPDQIHVLQPSNDTRLTIYTCTGFLDLKRFVVVAILKK